VFYKNLSMTPGDLGSLSQLFFDNLSTLLGALFALQGLGNVGPISVSPDVMNEYVWGRIVPGVGISLLIGNVYYSWQAVRLTEYYGRQYTAQPYGLNTPAAFAFVFNIIYTIFFQNGGGDASFILGYKIALAANFITGIISVALGLIGPIMLKVVPPAGLMVPIAGIGFAFLGLEQLSYSIAAPIVGFNTIMWVYLGWYSGIKLGWGKFRCPEALMIILIGTVLGWITGLNESSVVSDAVDVVKWWGPKWTADEMFEDFDLVKDYLGIIIPIGISAAASTLMCLVSAKEAGDPYPVRESMIADGLGTCLASFFGSPFGTVLYIGHPAHKRSGAKIGYSLANGAIYFVMSCFGILALIQSIVNQATIGPIVFFVGLMVNEEALNFMPARHYSAYIIGLFPSVYDWVTNVADRAPLTGDGTYNTNTPGTSGWVGVLAWKRGALLVSLLWVSMLVNVLDRHWLQATIWAAVAATFAVFGIIHVPEAGFDTFSEATWEQCSGTADGGADCWDHAEQYMFFVAYIMLGVTFVAIHFAKKFDDTIEEPIDDESRHAFDDWFKDAAVETELKSTRHFTKTAPDADDDDASPEVPAEVEEDAEEAVPEEETAEEKA